MQTGEATSEDARGLNQKTAGTDGHRAFGSRQGTISMLVFSDCNLRTKGANEGP